LIRQVFTWDSASSSYIYNRANSFDRFCSADLPAQSALYNAGSGKGYAGRIFLNGEETTPEGRVFAHIATGDNAGTSLNCRIWEILRLKMCWRILRRVI
jgi:hypothetical protein